MLSQPGPLYILGVTSYNLFIYLKMDSFLANSADSNEMPHHFICAFGVCQSTHLGFPVVKG